METEPQEPNQAEGKGFDARPNLHHFMTRPRSRCTLAQTSASSYKDKQNLPRQQVIQVNREKMQMINTRVCRKYLFFTKYERNADENHDKASHQEDEDGERELKSESMLSRVIKSAFCLM